MSMNVSNRSNPPALLPVSSNAASSSSAAVATAPQPLAQRPPAPTSDEFKAMMAPYATRLTASHQAFASPQAAAALPISPAKAEALRQQAASAELGSVRSLGSPAAAQTAAPVAAPTALTPKMAECLKVLSTTPSVDAKDPSKVNPAYAAAIKNWPDAEPIWPHLQNRDSRESLAKYIIATDDTQARGPYSFTNLCTGFSTQLYMRFSSTAPTDKATLDALKTEAKVDSGSTPNKLRVPLFAAISTGHAYNAFLVDESRPNDIKSYMLYEPQKDWLLTPGNAWYEQHAGTFGVDISDVRYAEKRGFEHQDRATFLLTPAGELSAQNATRTTYRGQEINPVANLAREFAVAEKGQENWEHHIGKGTFEDYIRGHVKSMEKLLKWTEISGPNKGKTHTADDADLLKAAQFVVGRSYRTTLEGPPERMTADRYFQIIGRPDLRPKFQP